MILTPQHYPHILDKINPPPLKVTKVQTFAFSVKTKSNIFSDLGMMFFDFGMMFLGTEHSVLISQE